MSKKCSDEISDEWGRKIPVKENTKYNILIDECISLLEMLKVKESKNISVNKEKNKRIRLIVNEKLLKFEKGVDK